jgi:hypothetical protein
LNPQPFFAPRDKADIGKKLSYTIPIDSPWLRGEADEQFKMSSRQYLPAHHPKPISMHPKNMNRF